MIDTTGAVLWETTVGGPLDEAAWAITLLDGGDALVLGQTESFGRGAEDIYLIRMNMRGDTVWTRHAGGAGTDRAFIHDSFRRWSTLRRRIGFRRSGPRRPSRIGVCGGSDSAGLSPRRPRKRDRPRGGAVAGW